MAVSRVLNRKRLELDVEPDVPLLWAIREAAGLTGTKYGCGMSLCGACTVHLNGRAIRSCVTPVRSVADRPITTTEGVSGPVAQAVLQSGQKIDVAQCGYCQPGQIMSAIALLEQTPVPTDVVGSDYHKCIGREGALVSSDLCFGESAPALRKPEA